MTDAQWKLFFELLEQIIAVPKPWPQKREEIISRACQLGHNGDLKQFVAWIAGADDPADY